MKLTPIEHGLDLAKATEGYERTPGVHMSDIYNAFYEELEPKKYRRGGELPKEKMELGTSFEEVLEEAIRRRVLTEGGAGRPGEFTTDEGVIFTPDHFFFNGVTRLGEFKLTWYSNVGLTDPRFNKWLSQMKLYGHHLQMPEQRLIVFFVNGNYKPPSPQLCAWDIEFTRREMADEWELMRRFAIHRGIIK